MRSSSAFYLRRHESRSGSCFSPFSSLSLALCYGFSGRLGATLDFTLPSNLPLSLILTSHSPPYRPRLHQMPPRFPRRLSSSTRSCIADRPQKQPVWPPRLSLASLWVTLTPLSLSHKPSTIGAVGAAGSCITELSICLSPRLEIADPRPVSETSKARE